MFAINKSNEMINVAILVQISTFTGFGISAEAAAIDTYWVDIMFFKKFIFIIQYRQSCPTCA